MRARFIRLNQYRARLKLRKYNERYYNVWLNFKCRFIFAFFSLFAEKVRKMQIIRVDVYEFVAKMIEQSNERNLV